MSDKNANFALEIRPASGGPKNGFKAEARLGSGDFQELVLRYKLPGGDDFNNLTQFDSKGTSTICTVSRALIEPLFGKKPKFFAVATMAGGPQTSNEVEVDLT